MKYARGACMLGSVALLIVAVMGFISWPSARIALQAAGPMPRVNAPYFSGPLVLSDEAALFWFGQVNSTSNYADVRVGYNDTFLQIDVHIIDRTLWYDLIPSVNDMTQWDATSLYLKLSGNNGSAPTSDSHRFVAQHNHWQPRDDYQAAFGWSGTNWTAANTPFTTLSSWRGSAPRDIYDDRGWWVEYRIPFTSLGLTGPPAAGTSWGLALIVHDRDNSGGTPLIPDQVWPKSMDALRPATWGELHFGQPGYAPPAAIPRDVLTVRQGLNGASVIDAHVGGHGNCGAGVDHWDEWGYTNYAGYTDINIQNQWDLADYSCFSKYFVTFPLGALPAGKAIISATLTMRQFGNANPAKALPSLIQVATVDEGWSENSITWNNAPHVQENVSAAWADPIPGGFSGWPAAPRKWDVGRAVAEAYAAGTPLSLALYSPDGNYHSGKYFSSSDLGNWGAINRPTLEILWGDPIFDLIVNPPVQLVRPGDAVDVVIEIQHSNGFNDSVSIDPIIPPTGLTSNLAPPTSFTPPGGQTTLTLTDQHSPSFTSGLWYTTPVSATSGSVTKSTPVRVLLNGSQVFLPVIQKR